MQDLDGNRQQIYDDRVTQYQRRLAVFERLISERRYDLSVLWVGTTDSIQHYCWNYPDLIVQYFAMVDEDLQRLARQCPQANFLVVSDHGFAAVGSRAFFANSWLRSLGYLSGGQTLRGQLLRAISARVRSRVSPAVRKRIKRLLGRGAPEGDERAGKGLADGLIFSSGYGVQPGVDWASTDAYLTSKWGIALSSRLDDDARRSISDYIIEGLRELRDPSGERIVQEAWRREDIYKGRHVSALPDVVFVVNPRYTARPHLSHTFFGPDPEASRTISGSHDACRKGIFLAWGPDIQPSSDCAVDIADITPTALQLLGCSIPDNMDGNALSQLLKGRIEASYVAADLSVEQTPEASAYSQEETEVIRQRLEDLGYL